MATRWIETITQSFTANRRLRRTGRVASRLPSLRPAPALESLEERTLLSTTGVAWNDPRHLTLSFAPDGTAIAGHSSDLFQSLDASMPTATWQREILRAFQTWSAVANIDVSLESDSGDPFGTPGPTQGDARFGDIRVGAQEMTPEVLSVSVPHDPFLSGTWAGDVLLNSSYAFGTAQVDLFSTMLHETGHVLGLGHSDDSRSVMFAHSNLVQQLTTGDIAAVQSLYGVRAADRWELTQSNGSIATATRIKYAQVSDGFDGAMPLILFGDVTTPRDVDYFSLRPLDGYSGPVTFRVQTAGVSLLAPSLTVFDAAGRVMGRSRANSGGMASVHLNRVDSRATYFARVEGATTDIFAIGGFGLAATFDANLTVSGSAIDEVLRGPYEELRPDKFADVFNQPEAVFFNDDLHADDTLIGAASLKTAPGFVRSTHYEAVASLSDTSDVDVYRVRAGDSRPASTVVLTTTVRSLVVNGVAPRVTVLDSAGRSVAADVLTNGRGTFTIQVPNATPRASYFLVVASPDANAGNYAITAHVGLTPANLQTFVRGSLTSQQPSAEGDLFVAETQLFQFLLSADGLPRAAVNLTILDGAGNVLFNLSALTGDTTSGDGLFLAPGAYVIRFGSVIPDGRPIQTVTFALLGDNISDPVGPVIADPTIWPTYQCPNRPAMFCYPGGRQSPKPSLIVVPRR